MFTRSTSGLVRDLSIFDAALIGIISTLPLSFIQYLFPENMFYAPGANLTMALVLGLLLSVPLYIVYAGLGSAMPRAGGDYVFQSRSLHPGIGFGIDLGWNVILDFGIGAAVGALVASTSGFSTVFLQLGYSTGSQQLIDVGSWCATPWGSFTAGLVGGIIPATLIVLAGPKYFRGLQKYVILPGFVITPIGMSLLFLTTTHAGFVASFNAWGLKVAGDPDLYDTVMKSAVAAGYQTPAVSLRETLVTMLLTFSYVVYSVASAMGLLGEVKKASNFKLLLGAYAIIGVYFTFVIMIPMTYSFQNVIGWDFMHALSYAYMSGLIKIPFLSYSSVAGILLANNPILFLILSWGFLQSGVAGANAPMLMSRPLVAMSLDGALPSWFGNVNKRLHSPMNAVLTIALTITFFMVLLNFWPETFFSILFNGYLFAGVAIMGVTALAAAVFHIRAKQIFSSSPVAKYGLLLPVAGLVGFIEICIICTLFLMVPELGLNLATAWTLLLGVPVLCVIYFFVRRSYLKRRGVDMDAAYREIPPE